MHQGKPLIGHVVAALEGQCAGLVICGLDWGGFTRLEDMPGPGLGPMGGLCAALHHGAALGHSHVLAAPCDLLGIADDVADRLFPGPAVAEGQWLLGLWPCAGAARLENLLSREGAIPARRWVSDSAARSVAIPFLHNVNYFGDLR